MNTIPATRTAMVLERSGGPLVARELPCPRPGPGEVLIAVSACGVCRTDLHLVDGELPDIHYPVIPGHQIVGRVLALGDGVTEPAVGTRVGVAWLASTCGHCGYCRRGSENLCDEARFTGYHVDGGYATHCLARADFVYPLPEGYEDLSVAPLLCGGLIGYRALRACGDAYRLGLYGFGSAAHMIAQVAVRENRQVYAFTRPRDEHTQHFARSLGCAWAGASDELPPQPLDAAIIFAADGRLVPQALLAVAKGGVVVCAGIHMSEIPAFDYERLWGERVIRSIANLTRDDGREFLALAPKVPVHTHTRIYPLSAANEALADLRAGRLEGSAVLTMG